ncbi:DUF1802 family protein [Methanobacterium sp.]|uniref:DUF1802 family protein n=1 Tax=Methanobacterium sp. TaxID=2164 RepID=UPI003159510B
MPKIKKCLNEWNATIEALGQGKQTILIRKYGTNLDKFLLYPTVSYALQKDYFKSFKEKYQGFVKNNALPKKEGKKTEVKYVAFVDKVIKRNSKRIGSFNKYHIWTNNHVKSYLGRSEANIWVLRIYKLNKSIMSTRTMAKIYANLEEEVSLDNIQPVISDEEFSKIIKEIESKK